jgi:transmembrane sensor
MNINTDSVDRFFRGSYSRKDFLTVKSYITENEDLGELRNHFENQWLELSDKNLPEDAPDQILDRIHRQIRHESIPERPNGFVRVFQKVAAILIIPLLLGFLLTYYLQSRETHAKTAMAEILCPEGVRTKFVLPDGTTGFLNSGSSLEYPVHFTRERNVSLKGEAYFDVVPDIKRPFTVKTPHLSTRVLGTQFNVIAYENENLEEIILKEGQIVVFTPQGKKLATLKPDQKLGVDLSAKTYKITSVQADQYVSWTEGKLVFRNESIQQVANRLGRWFNVELEVKDPDLLQYVLWATFEDEPLEEVLKLLALAAPIKYEVQIRTKTANHTYKKRKVTISLDESRLDAF